MQWVFMALLLNPELRVAVANVEMSAMRLLDRQLARLSGVPLSRILRREYEPMDAYRLTKGFERIRAVVDRIAFVQGPYDLARVADVADEFEADLLVFDYLQRFDVAGRHNGLREKINAQMSMLRQFAASGVGIIAAAALTRSKDSAGRSSYGGKHLGMASFRESSELEYGCDEAFLLFAHRRRREVEEDESIQRMMLAHVKSPGRGADLDHAQVPPPHPEVQGDRRRDAGPVGRRQRQPGVAGQPGQGESGRWATR